MEKIKILVVDDESRMRKLVRDFLEREGYAVLEAGDGMEALDLFLGQNGTNKLLNGRKPYYSMYEDINDMLVPILPKLKLKADDIDMFTNVKDLATAYGIIIDKELKALELKQKRETSEEDLQKVKDILVTIKEVANGD